MRCSLVLGAVSSVLLVADLTYSCGQETAAPTELVVTPRAVERPLMKYRLLPAEFELKEGNAAPILLRLPWDQLPYFNKVVPTFPDYLDVPLDDPKLTQSGGVLGEGKYAELRRAAYRRDAQWEYPFGGAPTAWILLPDVQGARDIIGRGLSVWIRYQISQGELDAAREAIVVGMATSAHYQRTPLTIIQLVVAAIRQMMLDRVEELVSQPEAPNLYWALTSLRLDSSALRRAVEFEQDMLQTTIPALQDLETARTPQEWRTVFDALLDVMQHSSAVGRTSEEEEANNLRSELVRAARVELPRRTGVAPDRIAAMSDDEAMVRWFMDYHREHNDLVWAAHSVPVVQALPRLRDAQQRIREFRERIQFPTLVIEKPLNVAVAVWSVERRIAALRTVEALRHYAATHDGAWPQSLDDLEDTPVPVDPLTNEPFEYRVEGDSAFVSAQPIMSDDKPLAGIRYQVKLRQSR